MSSHIDTRPVIFHALCLFAESGTLTVCRLGISYMSVLFFLAPCILLAESATEGDSFILSFFSAADALAFGQAFQAGLLVLPYPDELLAHPLCSPVWVVPKVSPAMFVILKCSYVLMLIGIQQKGSVVMSPFSLTCEAVCADSHERQTSYLPCCAP
jgi:hypothetical protein